MQGRSIQKSDGSQEEAVLESVGTCPQTFVSFSRRKKVEERMAGVHGVLNYAGCFSKAVGIVDGREAGLRDGLGFTVVLEGTQQSPSYRREITE